MPKAPSKTTTRSCDGVEVGLGGPWSRRLPADGRGTPGGVGPAGRVARPATERSTPRPATTGRPGCSTAAGCARTARCRPPTARSTRPRPSSGWPVPRPGRGSSSTSCSCRLDARPVRADGRAGHAAGEPPQADAGQLGGDAGDGRRAWRRSSTSSTSAFDPPDGVRRARRQRGGRRCSTSAAPWCAGPSGQRSSPPQPPSLVVPYLNRLSDLSILTRIRDAREGRPRRGAPLGPRAAPEQTRRGGLEFALRQLAERSSVLGPRRLQFRRRHDRRGLPPEHEHALLRIAQEAVSNAVRHAHPSNVRIGCRKRPTIGSSPSPTTAGHG